MQSFKSISKLQYHKHLNPMLWHNDILKEPIRQHLLEIGRKWEAFAKIPQDAIIDYTLTGGNANYSYNDNLSDLDVHILVDFSKMPIKDPDLMHDYIMKSKDLWGLKHNIKVLGFPVELYAQDVNEPVAVDRGTYSLLNNAWITHPNYLHVTYKNPELITNVNNYIAAIDAVVKSDDLDAAKALKQSIVDKRAEGLRKENSEFATGNLIFKSLRNSGDLGKISNFITSKEDSQLSYK